MFRIGLLLLLVSCWFVSSIVNGNDEEIVLSKRRLGRSVLSLPDNTSCKVNLKIIQIYINISAHDEIILTGYLKPEHANQPIKQYFFINEC